MDVRAGALHAPGWQREAAPQTEPGIFHSTHLLRELIAADARSEAAEDPLADRAEALLSAVLSGLELGEGAIVRLDPNESGGVCLAARGIPDHARELLEARLPHLESLGGALAQRAIRERRVLLLDRATRDALMPALREANPEIENAAVVPLSDQGVPVGVLLLAAPGGRLSPPLLRSLAIAFRLLGVLLAPGRGRPALAPPAEDPVQATPDSERDLFEIEELTQRLEEARAMARQLEERSSTADAALRAELESARARNAQLEAELAGVGPDGARERELADLCAAQSRTIEEHEQRVAELEGEVHALLQTIAGARIEQIAMDEGSAPWNENATDDGPLSGDDDPVSETIVLSDGSDEQLGDIAAAAAAAIGDADGEGNAGNDGDPECRDVRHDADGDAFAPEVEIDAAAEIAPELAVDEAGPMVAILHVDSRDDARELARQSADDAGAAYWCGVGDMPHAANPIVAVNLLDDALAAAVDGDPHLWAASRWIVYGADAATGMGFDLGSCALLRRPIDPRCCLEQIQRKAGKKINGLLMVTAQLREVAALRQALQEVDAAGSVACDTRQALDLLEIVRRPDAVLIDLALPQGQGFALAAQLKRQPETSSLPLLLLLPPVVDPVRLRGEAEKAQLLGPFVAEDVHRLIRATLAGRA